ncbi:hypothetical protein [Streptomyces sp. NPDC051310]|uniref:hypothetical protein n=1 Tax=Streptomyces sp. NPDC051310 TaxID=3365649 RepID=UPI003789C97C
MTVHIEGVHLLILAIGCLVGYAAYKHSRTRHHGLPVGPGDVIGAIGAAAAVITVLMLLFGDAPDVEADGKKESPRHAPSSPTPSTVPSVLSVSPAPDNSSS